MAAPEIKNALETVFKVQPSEQRRTSLMFIYLLLGMSAFILGRTVRDTLFLSYYKSTHLPLMYIAVAVAVSLVAAVYSRWNDRFRRDRFICWVDVGMGAILLLFWFLARLNVGDWIYPTLYIYVEIMGGLIVVMFWTLANEIFTSREAKRLFGLIGAGGVLANVVSGLLTGWLVKKMGISTKDLMLLTAVYLFLGGYIMTQLGKSVCLSSRPAQKGRGGGLASTIADLRDVLSSKHLTNIALLVAIMSLAISFVDYQFKMSARQTYHGDELTVFFSWFVGGTGILASLMQFFVTGRLLERFGVMSALLLLPIGMGSGLMWFIPAGVLGAAVVSQASNYVFRYTINDATMQLLYIPVNAARRSRAKAFIDGMLKQWFNGLAGVALFLLTLAGIPLSKIAMIPAVLIGLWLLVLLRVKSEYLRSLMETLRKRGLDLVSAGLNADDTATIRMLRGLLTDKAARPDHLFHALDLIQYAKSHNWVPELTALLSHEDARIRRRTLELLGESQWGVDLREMVPCLEDKDEQVRASAVTAYCQILKDRAVNQVKPFLRDPSPRIRAAAVSGLIKYCGLDGILEAAEVLKNLLENDDPNERFWGASTLRQISVSNFYRTLFKLLGDRDVAVQKEAIAAAGEMRSVELLPALMYKLGLKETASAAQAALLKYGDGAVETLQKVLSNSSEKNDVRARVPRVLCEVGTQKALDALMKCLRETDDVLRIRIITSVARIRHAHPELTLDMQRIGHQMMDEIRKAYQAAVIMNDLSLGGDGWNLLREALEVHKKRYITSALKLVECQYPQSQMNLVVINLGSDVPAIRANAIEAIDNMVSRKIGRLLIPLIESSDPASDERAIREVGGVTSLGRRERMQELLKSPDGWLSACVMREIMEDGPEDLFPEIGRLISSPNVLCRETVLYCMLSKRRVDIGLPEIEKLKFDRSPLVAAFACEVIRRGTPGAEGAK